MFDTINLAFTKGYFILYNENKITFCFKKGFLLDLKISDFDWKRGVFSQRIREKGVFFKLGYERGIRFGREWGDRVIMTSLQYYLKLLGGV